MLEELVWNAFMVFDYKIAKNCQLEHQLKQMIKKTLKKYLLEDLQK
jgi:hypothetical protein